jgi:hypothetical protein
MQGLAERVLLARLERLHWVEGLGVPLIEGHMPAEVLGEKTAAEVEWFGLARVTVKPEPDPVVLPPMQFRCGDG